MKSLAVFIKNEIVLCISFVLALISMCLIHVDKNYISYIDFRTLSILLCLMLIMAGLQKLLVFRQIGELLVSKVSSTRGLAFVLVLLCFFFSMLITNDVSLITFVPFTIIVLKVAKQNRLLVPVIVFETIAANLGSMTTPIGNPQNLYLYSLADMTVMTFLKIMLPYSILALILLVISILLFVKQENIDVHTTGEYARTNRERRILFMYVALFILALMVVIRILDYRICLLIVVAAVLIFDRTIMQRADYSLILTFVCLFIFIGNMKRIELINQFLGGIVVGHEVITSVLASQVISNVPAAILLSGFTSNISGLIVGTNLGGLGTLIASMASLISFKQYGFVENANKRRYLIVFTVANIVFLLAMLLEAYFIRSI